MTHRIRKEAPAGATHFATISGKLAYIRIDECNNQFIHAGEWIPSVLLDERFNLQALKLEVNPVFYAMIAMMMAACALVWFMFWGAK